MRRQATTVSLDAVSVRYGDTTAVHSVDLQIRSGEIFALVGPSGCGKTSLLKSIAGLEPVASGSIRFDDRIVDALPAHRREVGLVFQNYALFPHMRVDENVAFGLKMHGITADRASRVTRAMDLLQIGHLARSWPDQLSGGQQQRVALARTLVVEPRILLLDEPLSALDRQLRDTMRTEIRSMVKSVGITTIIVTHDQEEAMSMADRIGVMRAGRLEQVGTGRELYHSPATPFVAGFVGRVNRLSARMVSTGADRVRLNLGGQELEAKLPDDTVPEVDAEVELFVRYEAVRPAHDPSGGLAVQVLDRVFFGDRVEMQLRLSDGQTLKAEVSDRDAEAFAGDGARVLLDPSGCFAFRKSAS